jgi:hypothetical protein
MNLYLPTTAITFLVISSLSQAWILGTPNQQFSGEDDFGCTAIYVAKGEKIKYDVGWTESCTLRIYNDANCHVQIGISSNDWKRTLTRPMWAFDVQDCGDLPF